MSRDLPFNHKTQENYQPKYMDGSAKKQPAHLAKGGRAFMPAQPMRVLSSLSCQAAMTLKALKVCPQAAHVQQRALEIEELNQKLL